MNEEKLDALLGELKKKDGAGEFAPAENFKAEFFERARREKEALPLRRTVLFLRLAGAAAVLIVIAAVLMLPASQHDPRRFFPELEVKLRDALPLFGGDKGIGFAGDTLLSFDRSSKKAPDRLWLLAVFDKENRTLGSFVFALGGSEVASLSGDSANGEFLTARTADGSEVLKADLTLLLTDGKYLALQDTMVGSDGELFYSSGSPYRIERTLIKLN